MFGIASPCCFQGTFLTLTCWTLFDDVEPHTSWAGALQPCAEKVLAWRHPSDTSRWRSESNNFHLQNITVNYISTGKEGYQKGIPTAGLVLFGLTQEVEHPFLWFLLGHSSLAFFMFFFSGFRETHFRHFQWLSNCWFIILRCDAFFDATLVQRF